MSALQLRVRGTDEYLLVDESDWTSVRDVVWEMRNGVVVNGMGVSYNEFVGIPSDMHNMYGLKLDKRRKFMIGGGLMYEFSECEGCFILKERDNG